MKKRFLLIFAIFLLTLFAFKCGLKRREDISKKQIRNGLVYIVNETQPYTGTFVAHYSNGQLKLEANFQSGKLYGLLKGWYKNGQLKSEQKFKYDFSYGKLKEWDSYGNLIMSSYERKWKQWEQMMYEKHIK